MSRGHGKIQRAVLALLPDRMFDAEMMGEWIYGRRPTAHENASIRRALRRLAEEGHVVRLGGRLYGGGQAWGTPGVARRMTL